MISNSKNRSATVKLDPSTTAKTYDPLRDDGLLSLNGSYTWDGGNIRIVSHTIRAIGPRSSGWNPKNKNRIRVWTLKK